MNTKRDTQVRHSRKFSQTIYFVMAISIMCIILISVVISMLNTYWLTRDRVLQEVPVILQVFGEELENSIQHIKQSTERLSWEPDVQRACLDGNAGSELEESFSTAAAYLGNVDGIALFSADGNLIYGFEDEASKLDEAEAFVGQPSGFRWFKDNSLAFYQAVYGDQGERCGTLMMCMNVSLVQEMLRQAEPLFPEGILVQLSTGETIYENGKTGAIRGAINELIQTTPVMPHNGSTGQKRVGIGHYVFRYTGPQLNVFCMIETRSVFKNVTSSWLGYTFIALLLSIILLILGNMLVVTTTKPLALLLRSVCDFSHGNMKVRFPPSSIREIDVLSTELNNMAGTIERLIEDNRQKQKSLYEKEIQILWTQFNPHLLYNSMNTIVDTALHGEIQKVVDITMALAKYFQYTLSRGDDLIPIRSEISHAENYMIIQKIRFENLDYEIDIDESIMNYRIPKLILQPIIENSIYHGIKGFVREGMIRLRAHMNAGNIVLIIEDNGRGMRHEELEGLFLPQTKQNSTSGIGLNNIFQRLQLYFGEEGTISVKSVFRKGTCVTIQFPAYLENS